jgi:hypothetical protein
MMLNEVEAAQALGELARERKAAGRPGLTEGQAAYYLRGLAEVRSLPEVASATPYIPQPRSKTRRGRVLVERFAPRAAGN